MRIGIYSDNTLPLPLSQLCEVLNRTCATTRFELGRSSVHLNTSAISHPTSIAALPSNLKKELQSYDSAVICTTIRYDNNFFFEGDGNITIVSFFAWNMLTDLPITNGLVYFISSMLCDEYHIGRTHEEANTGCVNDFWRDKRGVDLGMRAAFLCGICRQMTNEKTDVMNDIQAMLDLVASASRRGNDVLVAALPTIPVAGDGFDVFLCHNGDDKSEIRKMNAEFQEAGLRTWLDEERIRPGLPWQAELEKQIKVVRAACVFVGENGLGPWQDAEVRAFLTQFFKRQCPVVPVILPSASTIPELPIFLQEMMWVDLRKDYAHGLARLIGALRPK